jgi:porin
MQQPVLRESYHRLPPALRLLLSMVLVMALASSAEADGTEPGNIATRASFGTKLAEHLRSSAQLFGDPGGYRSLLDRAGLTVQMYYNHFYGTVFGGGRRTGPGEPNSGSIDLLLLADLERARLIDGGQALMHVKAHFHRNVNPRIGALSDPFDDADGDKWFYIDQLWYQQGFFDHRVELRLGYLDQQTILDRNAYANSEDKQFMATFLDNDNAAIPLAIGLGATLFVDPTGWLTIIAGVANAESRIYSAGFDSTFDDARGFFRYLEADVRATLPSPRGGLAGNYRFGMVSDPRERPRFAAASATGDPRTKREDFGFYLSFDQMLLRERPGDSEGLGAFARYGYRAPDVNRIDHFWSVGLQYEGLLPGRPTDALGLGMYWAHLSDALQLELGEALGRELGVEVYYRVEVTPWLAVTPDLQYIDSPGGYESAPSAWVGGLRARLSL